MLNTLLESSAVAPRRRVSSIVSLVLHVGVGAAIVVASGRATELPAHEPAEAIVYMAPPPELTPPTPVAPTPVAPTPASADASSAAAPPSPATPTAPVFVAPDFVPLSIPDINLSRAVTDANDFSSRRAPAASAGSGDGSALGALGSGDGVWTALQVDKAVAVRPGSPTPLYPEVLRSGSVPGSVRARFVVDSTGRVDFTRLTIVQSDHELFTRAVKVALRKMRYVPAAVGGRPVAQLVEQSFVFEINR